MSLLSLVSKKHPPTIFISYRRDDNEGYAGRLRDSLEQHFRPSYKNYFKQRALIFRDFDNIPPGIKYMEFIKNSIASCAIFIPIIGKQSLKVIDAGTGQRRIDNPNDPLRIEIATALSKKVRVVPVLTKGASMPQEVDLPDQLKELASINAIEIGDPGWEDEVNRLIKELERILSQQNNNAISKEFSYRRIAILIGLFAVFATIGLWGMPYIISRQNNGKTNVNKVVPQDIKGKPGIFRKFDLANKKVTFNFNAMLVNESDIDSQIKISAELKVPGLPESDKTSTIGGDFKVIDQSGQELNRPFNLPKKSNLALECFITFHYSEQSAEAFKKEGNRRLIVTFGNQTEHPPVLQFCYEEEEEDISETIRFGSTTCS